MPSQAGCAVYVGRSGRTFRKESEGKYGAGGVGGPCVKKVFTCTNSLRECFLASALEDSRKIEPKKSSPTTSANPIICHPSKLGKRSVSGAVQTISSKRITVRPPKHRPDMVTALNRSPRDVLNVVLVNFSGQKPKAGRGKNQMTLVLTKPWRGATILIEVATKCIGSIDYWESLTNRIHGSFSSRSTMRVLVDP